MEKLRIVLFFIIFMLAIRPAYAIKIGLQTQVNLLYGKNARL